MDKVLRFGALLVYLSFSAPAFAQAYGGLPMQANSTNCRAVAGQANIDGSMQQIIGRACLQSDGTWQFEQSSDGSVLWYPVAAYPYPDPWWWGPPIFIGAGVSFIFVDRFHHFHHFHHFSHFHQLDHNHFGKPVGAGFRRGPFPSGGMRGFGGVQASGGMRGFGGMRASSGMRGFGGMQASSGMHGFGGMRRR